jgi:hypothetical protein
MASDNKDLRDIAQIVCVANKSVPGRVRVVCTDTDIGDYDQKLVKEYEAASQKRPTPFYVVFGKQVLHADEKFAALTEVLSSTFASDGAFYRATPNDIYPYFVLMDGLLWSSKCFDKSTVARCRVLADPVVMREEAEAEAEEVAEAEAD